MPICKPEKKLNARRDRLASVELMSLLRSYTVPKMKFSIKKFFSKYDRIRSFLRIWSHLLKKSLMQNFIFCTVIFRINFWIFLQSDKTKYSTVDGRGYPMRNWCVRSTKKALEFLKQFTWESGLPTLASFLNFSTGQFYPFLKWSENKNEISTIIFIMFWDFLMFYQTFLSPQVKQCVIITYKHRIYGLPHELPNALSN